MSKLGIIAAAFLAISCEASSAEDQGTRDCFTIVAPPAASGDIPVFGIMAVMGAIRINKCTGESWMLIKAAPVKGSYSYRWFPIGVMNAEAVWPESAQPPAK